MNLTKNFSTQELVCPEAYELFGDQAIMFLDPKLVNLVQFLREQFGPTVVNNWHVGGQYKESGFRMPTTKTGGKLSQHKFGRAADLKFTDTTPQEVYAQIMASPQRFLNMGLACMEDINHTPTWLHVDVRWHTKGGILIVKP